jgi:hypothetical protein
MKKSALMVVVLSSLFGSAASLRAQSALDTPCIAQSLANYLSMYGTDSNGAGCSVGIENFSEFAFSNSGTATLDSASQIEVTPATAGGGMGFTFSQFSGQFSVPDNETALYQINYLFVVDPVPSVPGASLGMDPVFGNVSTDQLYCPDSDFMSSDSGLFCQVPDPSTFTPQDLHVDNTNPPASLNTGIVALSPVVMNYANVMTNISLNGTGLLLGSGFDSVTGLTFTSTPEPYTWLLMLGGLLAIIVRKRISNVPS